MIEHIPYDHESDSSGAVRCWPFSLSFSLSTVNLNLSLEVAALVKKNHNRDTHEDHLTFKSNLLFDLT